MGWDDDSHKDESAFKSILRFLRDEDLKVRAILWMILPNIRQGGAAVSLDILETCP